MQDSMTISMAGSSELSWDDIDNYSQKKGFKTTAGFIQYLCEKEILGFKTKTKDIIVYIMLMIIMVMILLLLIVR